MATEAENDTQDREDSDNSKDDRNRWAAVLDSTVAVEETCGDNVPMEEDEILMSALISYRPKGGLN